MSMYDTIRTMAHCDEAFPHDIDATGGTTDVAFKEVIEVTVLQQRAKLAGYELPNVVLCCGDFVEEAFSSVDDKKDVFRIPAHEKIIVSAPGKGFELRRKKQRRRQHLNG